MVISNNIHNRPQIKDKLKIAIIFLGIPFAYNGEHYSCWASKFTELRHYPKFFDTELICAVVKGEAKGHIVNASEMIVHQLQGWEDGKDLYLTKFLSVVYGMWRLFSSRAKEWDIVLIMDPDPLSQVAFLLSILYKRPRILYLRGDDVFEIMHRNKHGVRHLLASVWCKWLDVAVPLMFSKSLGVVTGQVLYDKYRTTATSPIKIYASSVTEKELKQRRMTTKHVCRNALNLLLVANLTSYKGVDITLKAVKILVEKNLDIKFAVIGEGPEDEVLREITRELHLCDVASFYGFIPYGEQLFHYYDEADVFLLPSKSEGTPKVISEALSFGLPVIASRVGGIPDMIIDGYNGVLLDNISAVELASAIERLAKSRAFLEELSRGAFASAARYTVEAQIGRVSEAINKWI